METKEIETKEEIKEAHENMGEHLHVLKRKDGSFSVIKEIDEDVIEEISDVYESEEEAKKQMDSLANKETPKEAKKEEEAVEVKEEETSAPINKVDIVDTDSEEESDPEEVAKFEEELKAVKK